ncbi:hypothetical protein P8452_11976 [Trifolium repens]|nr:hypothetical protein P8452_11976 [Trifolium repens]
MESGALALLKRDAFNKILQYASKNGLPQGLKDQIVAHTQLKFKTAELQQEEVLQNLPTAIRAGIAQHLFHDVVEKSYLFKGFSDDFISQLVSDMKAEYYPSKVDIILQNEMPAYFYILKSFGKEMVKPNSEDGKAIISNFYSGQREDFSPLSSLVPIRVKIHGHNHNGKIENRTAPKLIILPDSVEDLFNIAEKKFGKRGAKFLWSKARK